MSNYQDMLNLSNQMAWQGYRDIAIQRQAARQRQVELDVENIEKRLHDAERDPVRVDETIERDLQDPIYKLIAKAVWRCVDWGCPRELMPTFSAHECQFEKGTTALAEYDSRRALVIIRASAYPFQEQETESFAEKGGWNIEKENREQLVLETLVHEIGHHLRCVHMGADYHRPYDAYPNFGEIAGRVSAYAQKDHHEFCADVFKGMVAHGRSFDAEVLTMYRFFGGWERPQAPAGPVRKESASPPAPQVHVDVHVPPQPAPVIEVKLPEQQPPSVNVTVNPELKMPATTEKITITRDPVTGDIKGAFKETK